MRRYVIGFLAVVLGVSLAVAVTACGGNDETTTVTQTAQTTPAGEGPAATTAPQAPTTTTGTGTTTTGTTTGTTTTGKGPQDCGPNQAFSQVSQTCVDVDSGNNPCPPGQVPMADQPVCVAKDS